MAEAYDAIVLGAGLAGGEVADRAARAGHRVALVYREPWGSTCANTGCVPSKFLLHRARVAHLARTAERFHVRTGDVEVDVPGLIREKRALIRDHREESHDEWKEREDLTLVQGAARFVGPREIEAAGRRLRARRIFIATGLRPLVPPLDGLEEIEFLTSESLMELETLPEHLVIVGGGYVGCELGQAWRRFGSRVTLIQGPDRLLPREEPEVSRTLQEALEEEDIRVHTGVRAQGVRREGDRLHVTAEPKGGGTPQEVEGTHLLLATGRRPNTDMLNLDAAGVETDERGFLKVNDHLETTAEGVYGIGDVNGHAPFTRVGSEEGKLAYANAFEGKRLRMEWNYLPHAVFTDPGIARVGLTEAEARERGHDVLAVTQPFHEVTRAYLQAQPRGFVKLVVRQGTRELLGASVIGPDGFELIYAPTLVMRHGGSVDELAKAVGVYPTLQEAVEYAAQTALQKLAPEEVEGPLVSTPVRGSAGGRT